MGIWAYCLHLFGFAFFAVFSGKPEDRASRRERIKQMGKLRYILMFGGARLWTCVGIGNHYCRSASTRVSWLGRRGRETRVVIRAGGLVPRCEDLERSVSEERR